jgi:hypothetical protein
MVEHVSFGKLPSRYYKCLLGTHGFNMLKAYDFDTQTNQYIFKVIGTGIRQWRDEYYTLESISRSGFDKISSEEYHLAELLYG